MRCLRCVLPGLPGAGVVSGGGGGRQCVRGGAAGTACARRLLLPATTQGDTARTRYDVTVAAHPYAAACSADGAASWRWLAMLKNPPNVPVKQSSR